MRAATAALRLGWRVLLANSPRLVVLLAGSVAVSLAASAIALASVANTTVVRQAVADGWRGPYDILVRPTGSTTLRVDGRQLVPSNYLGTPSSGLTRAQWDAVASIPGVDVAAPVAALGWVKPGSSIVGVRLPLPAANEIVHVELSTTVGETVTTQHGYAGYDPNTGFAALLAGAVGGRTSSSSLGLDSGLLPSAWGLVVGVDPLAEDDLTGIADEIDGDWIEPGLSMTSGNDGEPVIALRVVTAGRQPVTGTLDLAVSTTTATTTAANIQAAWVAYQTAQFEATGEPVSLADYDDLVKSYTSGGQTRPLFRFSDSLDRLIEPLRPARLAFGADGRVSADPVDGAENELGANALLVPAQPHLEAASDATLAMPQVGTWSEDISPLLSALIPEGSGLGGLDPDRVDDTIFRPLSVVEPHRFQLQPQGRYDLDALSARYNNGSNYAPLGIYGNAPSTLVADAEGNPVNQVLPRSLNPGGVNPLPPVGLTNLDTVEALRGDRFIDAIRVRVAGIEGYSPAALATIEQVAAAIIARTGLDVVVVAGSSPTEVAIRAGGVGTVMEWWTSLGEAPRITSAISGMSGLLIAAAGLVVLMYLLGMAVLVVVETGRELRVLELVGWRSGARRTVPLAQAAILGAVSGGCAAGVLLLMGDVTNVATPWWLVAAAAGGSILAHCAAVILVVARLERGSSKLGSVGRRSTQRLTSVTALALQNLRESTARTITLALALTVSAVVAGLVIGLQIGVAGRLDTSLFGQQIAVRVAPYHLLAAAAAVFAAAAMAIDNAILSVERRLSLLGLLRAVGWRAHAVRRLVSLETALPAAAAGLIAALGVAVVLTRFDITGWPLAAVVAGVAVLTATIGLVAAQPATALALRAQPWLTLRAEGATSAVQGFGTRAAIATVSGLALVVVAAGAAFGAIQPDRIGNEAIAPPPPTRVPTAVELRILSDVTAMSRSLDRSIGSTALVAVNEYLRSSLEDLGYAVTAHPYVAVTPQVRDRDGNPVALNGATLEILPSEIAYRGDPSELAESSISGGSIQYVDLTSGQVPDCRTPVVIMRVAVRVSDDLVPRAADSLTSCGLETTAVLGVVATDAAWSAAAAVIGDVSFQVADYLTVESNDHPSTSSTPWVVVNPWSTGPGATQSAAPMALALELARQAAESGQPLRLAFVTDERGELASTFLREAAVETPGARMVILGPLAGPRGLDLGTNTPDPIMTSGLLRTLLWSSVDIDDVPDPDVGQPRATSDAWLSAISTSIGIAPIAIGGPAGVANALGLDAAALLEDVDLDEGLPSIAGTAADTPDQVDVELLAGLADTLIGALTDRPPPP